MSTPNPLLENFALYLKLDCGLSANTIAAYTADLRQFLEISNPKSVSRLTKTDLLTYLDRLTVGTRSRARKVSALRLFFKYALQAKLCTLDPTAELESPKVKTRLPKTLSPDDVEALLSAPQDEGDAIMLRVLYAGGLRVSELIGLRPENADTQAALLRVQGKGDKVRIVPIDTQTADLVEKYLRQIRPERLKGKESADVLFLSKQGSGFTRQGFWKLVKKYAILAGISAQISPHVLRHAFATHLLERGMSLRSLQLLLGHSDISTTEIYSHISTQHLHETLRRHHPKNK